MSEESMKQVIFIHKKYIAPKLRVFFWFSTGALLGLFFLVSFAFIYFEKTYSNQIYPGIMVNGTNFGGKTKDAVETFYAKKNKSIENTKFVFQIMDSQASISAKDLKLGYDEKLLANQAYSIGRSDNAFSNISLIMQAYLNGLNLPPSYKYSQNALDTVLLPLKKDLTVAPVDALFTFENGKVTAFRPSSNGQEPDIQSVQTKISSLIPTLFYERNPQLVKLTIPIKDVKPSVSTDEVNSFGIRELIGTGTSLFQGSSDTRIFNVTLASSKVNGVLIPPNETFSFNKVLGDISSFTGFKQAYVIENGKTVLGDGGGVCQVSTTLFRAVLDAGLPIVERHAHAYRVHYYEEDSPPGIDATIYIPGVDFKFKNDTGHSILVQSVVDPQTLRLTFYLYGTKDNREISMSQPVITSQTPAPEPSYQDDPTLPKGTVKQVDFAAAGATIYFTRTVKKNGKTIITDRFDSNFKPWQAVFLRGTKE